jgi:hypothetical protein
LIAGLIMPSLPRRKVSLSLALFPFVAIAAPATATADLAALERDLHGEIGLATNIIVGAARIALNTFTH